MAVANTATLTTNFNVSPYYDDYDPAKEYYRILYKPGYAVQARELTQMQTMLQKQVDRFGKHIFREGSIVLPGKFNIETTIPYVKVRDLDTANTDVTITNYKSYVVTGQTTGIRAKIEEVVDGTETSDNAKTIYVSYLSSSTDGASSAFQPGEVLTSNVGTLVVASSVPTGASPITGIGSRFKIESGVLFAKEHFIYFETSSIILGRYSQTPSARVGFYITEDLITYSDDISLLDPALEASNYAAPGADRLKLTPTLQTRDYDNQENDPDFVELFTVKDGILTEVYERPQYNILRDELAKQKYDESGDYYVQGLHVRVRENLDTGNNGGYLTTGNNQLLSVGVEPGVGYVKGYEVNKLTTEYINVVKSTDFETIASQITSATYGNYVVANEFIGSVDHDKGTQVVLYDVPNRRVSNVSLSAATTPTGNSVGTAKVMSVEYNSGLLGGNNASVLVYLNDIKMNGTNSFANVRSLYTSGFGADIVLNTSNSAVIFDSALSTLLYYTGSNSTKSVRDSSGNPDITFNFKRTQSISDITQATTFYGEFDLSLTTSALGESFPYGTTSGLSDADKREIILSLSDSATVNCTARGAGTVSANAGVGNTYTLTSSGAFFNRFNIGDFIQIQGKSNVWSIAAIATDGTTLTTNEILPAGITGNNYSKFYKAGHIIDLTSKGFDAGVERVVSAAPTQLTFDLKETFTAPVSAKVTFQAVRSNSFQANKILRKNRFVVIDCSTAGTTGPFNLGFSDIYNVNAIYRKSSAPTDGDKGTNVTSSFIIDNGQRDMLYDHGTITPRLSLTTSDFLLVDLDYFEPSTSVGVGYFSIDSYPIDDDNTPASNTIRTENIPIFISPNTKKRYDLRNQLDFRPVKLITATDSITVSGASTNPTSSAGFKVDTNGLRLPVPSTQIVYDYQFYQARRDLIVINKDGVISSTRGVPAVIPITPEVPPNSMALASIYIAPYPSLAPNYAQQINRRDIGCITTKLSNIRFTMRDIGVLKQRIENLEYYVSLNLLEKAAVDLKIRDENGLERFKNGVFVDTFTDHSHGDVNNDEYRIVVDRVEKSIRPYYTMHSHYYDYLSGTGIKKTGDIVTLDYTEEVLIDQPRSTTNRNIELTSYRFIGNLYLTPDTEVWIDTNKLPDEVVYRGVDPTKVETGVSVEWNQWQTQITGQVIQQSLDVKNTKDTFKADADSSWGKPSPFVGDPKSLATGKSSLVGDISIFDSGLGNAEKGYLSENDYRITQTVKTTMTGVETTTSISEKTETVDSRLLNVSMIAYMRSQRILVRARGLKANTKLYSFFDGENVNINVRPLTSSEYTVLSSGAIPLASPTYAYGAQLQSDANGDAYLEFTIPPNRFRVGSRELVVTDSITNSIDASTYAKRQYVAYGLTEKRQDTIVTTRSTNITTREVFDSNTVTQYVYVNNPSCAAYSFLPKAPPGEEGLFITSVDLYFSAVHPTLGVWVELREMDNAGGITRNQLPFSEVWITADEIKPYVSANASTAFNIKFPAPVFVLNNVQYAFVIHTEGLNPDTYFWISRLGETDIVTGKKVNSRPLTGTFYTTNNNLNWDIVPDVDLKIKFYRANFTTGTAGQVVLGNKSFEKLNLSNVSSSIVNYGETFLGRTRLTLSGNTSSINVDDLVVGLTSGANSNVFFSNANTVFTVSNNKFQVGETVDIRYSSNNVSKGKTSLVTDVRTANGTIDFYKTFSGETKAEMRDSSGYFYNSDIVRGLTSGITATVDSVVNQRYSTVDFEPSYLQFSKTSISFEMQPTSNAGVQGSYIDVVDGDNYSFDTEQALLSRTNERNLLSGDRSNKVRVTMSSLTNYMSPVLDLGRTHTVYVDNIINANTKAESGVSKLVISDANGSINIGNVVIGSTSRANAIVEAVDGTSYIMSTDGFASGEQVLVYNQNMTFKGVVGNVSSNLIVKSADTGKLFNKYINAPVILAEGQDAEDVRIICTAYRPPSTDFKIWMKFVHNEDSDSLENRPWIELDKVDDTIYSSLANRNDFKEFNFVMPTSVRTGPNGEIQYKNSQGTTFTGYKAYQIKIGLLGGPENTTDPINSAIVPRVADLRVIALQM